MGKRKPHIGKPLRGSIEVFKKTKNRWLTAKEVYEQIDKSLLGKSDYVNGQRAIIQRTMSSPRFEQDKESHPYKYRLKKSNEPMRNTQDIISKIKKSKQKGNKSPVKKGCLFEEKINKILKKIYGKDYEQRVFYAHKKGYIRLQCNSRNWQVDFYVDSPPNLIIECKSINPHKSYYSSTYSSEISRAYSSLNDARLKYKKAAIFAVFDQCNPKKEKENRHMFKSIKVEFIDFKSKEDKKKFIQELKRVKKII